MKNVFKILASAVLAAGLAGCSAAAGDTVDFESGQAIVDEFGKQDFTVENFSKSEEGQVSFKVAGENGGANVRIQSFDSITEALDQYDQTKAAMTQSDYYMIGEKENGMGSMAVFNNSINYNYAIVAFDARSNTMVVVSEIAQDNLDEVYDVLAQYGFDFQ